MSSRTEDFFLKPDTYHGLAKKAMLYRYLQSRFSELLNYNDCGTKYRFIYFDAFAGTGHYSGKSTVADDDIPFGDPSYGSPIVALHALFSAMEKTYFSCSVLLIFEEIREDYLDQLKENVSQYFQNRIQKVADDKDKNFRRVVTSEKDDDRYLVVNSKQRNFRVKINFVQSRFSDFSIRENMPNDFDRTPVFSFVDPFGYSHTPMAKIKELIGYRKDVLITFMTSFISRFGTKFPTHINKLFGTENSDGWIQKIQSCQEMYKDRVTEEFRQEGRSLKVLSFSIKRTQNQVIYHMICFTDELRSLKHMKYGMCTANEKGMGLCFTDSGFDTKEPNFYPMTNQAQEAKFVYNHWKGQSCTFGEYKEWILLYSPFQYHSKVLRELEKKGQLIVDTYGEERVKKALPPYVGVNNNDPDNDYNKKRRYCNRWSIRFLNEECIETPKNKRKAANEDGMDAEKAKRKLF